MKYSYKLTGVALLLAVGLGISVPTISKAAPGDVVGKGNIKFTQDNSTNPSNVEPGESTGEINEPTQNTEANPLKIVSVTDLDFDTHAIVSNDANKTYDAKAFKTKFKENGNDTVMPHFIRFQDVRAEKDTNFFTISAELTKQFTNGSRVLNGATIDYKDISLVTGTNHVTIPNTAVAGTLEPTVSLALKQKKVILTNKQEGKGYGVFELMFGDKQKTKDKPEAYNSVTLNIPGSNVLRTGEYQAEITWSITDAN